MEIQILIQPDGTVTITTLSPELLPIAFALDPTNPQVKAWLARAAKKGSIGEDAIHDVSTPPIMEDTDCD